MHVDCGEGHVVLVVTRSKVTPEQLQGDYVTNLKTKVGGGSVEVFDFQEVLASSKSIVRVIGITVF